MLILQIKRIISSEKWFKYVITFFWGGGGDAKKFGSVGQH